MKKNLKTITDNLFEQYLVQEKQQYIYEPFNQKTTIPDYLVTKNNKKILIECEEIEKIPLDSVRPGVGSLDINSLLEKIRSKIYSAGKQLKPYINDVNYKVIIIGKKQGYNIDLTYLKWAMWGDPVIRIPLALKNNKRQKAFSDMKVKGALRKNDPMTKKMYFPHKYISAVGLIKQFNGLYYYKDKLYSKYCKNSNKLSLKKQLEIGYDFFEKDWRKYEDEIPKIFVNNPKKIAYKLEIVCNSFSDNPLPKSIFDGEWDNYYLPKIVFSKEVI